MTLSKSAALELLGRHGLHPRRALGQNFVVDPNTVRRIARLAGVGEGDRVVEIGAGLGSLTLALVESGAEVVAVEIDRHVMPALREVLASSAVRVIEGDALTLDWAAVLGTAQRWALVANLPYNIATPLVADLLDGVPQIDRMLVMVQREVGERLVASVGDPAYGAVSVKVAYWAEATIAGYVPPSVFLPRPKVDSALVSIVRRPAPAVDLGPAGCRDWFFTLVRTGFGQRRKMLRRSLASLVADDAFEQAGVPSTRRPEELDVGAWGRLARTSWKAATDG